MSEELNDGAEETQVASIDHETPDSDLTLRAYGGEGAFELESAKWRVASASITGPSHSDRNLPCDDAAASGLNGEWAVNVVCDGAGSALFGGEGAAIASREIVSKLLESLPRQSSALRLQTLIVESLANARELVNSRAVEVGSSISSFATTVVGSVCRSGRGVIFHLGDGLAVVRGSENEIKTTSFGYPQEYANETFFLTDRAWQDFLTFKPIMGARTICLMTDGVSPFAEEDGGVKSEFLDPIGRYFDLNPISKSAKAIAALLDSDVARQKVFDDKTLLWSTIADPDNDLENR